MERIGVLIADDHAVVRQGLRAFLVGEEDIDYDDLQVTLEHNLPHQESLFQEYHALIVQHGKSIGRKKPLCVACPLLPICGFGQSQTEVS